MFRLLFWIALIAAAVWLWRRLKKPAASTQTAREDEPAPMVRCAHCGVHVPRDKALTQDTLWFCSPAHRDQGGR